MLNRYHRRARLAYAHRHVRWIQRQWSNVLFTDESRFSTGMTDGFYINNKKMLFKIIHPIYYINKFLYEITYNTQPNYRKRYRSKYPIRSLTCKDVFVARQISGDDSAGMKDSNEGKLFDACLNENNEDYEKRITNRTDTREIISLSRDHLLMIHPTKLIKPNFIVDLMDTPGDFIPIGSPCSILYIPYY
ncbi:hypothetical protein ALC57_05019 [Trachymyrmex cornetzi]|uniref:Uncharacterized protein n=1 Tax=Trachymyrmex cornetzi TaxID=471704 RepID=A0A151JBW5_9HYME|nr:hypothetical protein ALC57_05019 [Trachymyrmex cornetzi]